MNDYIAMLIGFLFGFVIGFVVLAIYLGSSPRVLTQDKYEEYLRLKSKEAMKK